MFTVLQLELKFRKIKFCIVLSFKPPMNKSGPNKPIAYQAVTMEEDDVDFTVF